MASLRADGQWLGHRAIRRWCARWSRRWTAREGAWMQRELARVPEITPMPSAANFLLDFRSDAPWCRCGKLWSPSSNPAARLSILCRAWRGVAAHWLAIASQQPPHCCGRSSRLQRFELLKQQIRQLLIGIAFSQFCHALLHLREQLGIGVGLWRHATLASSRWMVVRAARGGQDRVDARSRPRQGRPAQAALAS